MVFVLFLIWMCGVLGYQGIPLYAEAAAQVQSYNIRVWQRQTADRRVRHYSNDEDMLKRNAGVEQSSNQNQNQPASTTSQPAQHAPYADEITRALLTARVAWVTQLWCPLT